ncbi:unnamed protein product [Amoebophrya sp. A25]|nr:unnamed protein product [Amoebophrya sp. A25]|eukprot:GSA25T00023586001.1
MGGAPKVPEVSPKAAKSPRESYQMACWELHPFEKGDKHSSPLQHGTSMSRNRSFKDLKKGHSGESGPKHKPIRSRSPSPPGLVEKNLSICSLTEFYKTHARPTAAAKPKPLPPVGKK